MRGFDVGDEVYGMAGGVGDRPGSLAEYAAVDADLLAAKPARLSMAEAAALPLAAVTAWEGLVDRAGVAPGHLVLVHGGAGGVGHVAVQLALARGATVFATGTGASLAAIKDLGAAVDYRAATVADYVATATAARVRRHLRHGGRPVLDDSFAAPAPNRPRGQHPRLGHAQPAPLSFRGATYSGVFTCCRSSPARRGITGRSCARSPCDRSTRPTT